MWGVSFPLLKRVVEYIPPMTLGCIRFLPGAALGLALVMLSRRRSEVLSAGRRYWYLLLGIVCFMVVIPNITQNIGMRHTTASLAALIQAGSPAFTVFLAPFFLHEALTRRKVGGLGICMAASAGLVISGGDIDLSSSTLLGNLLMLGTSVSYGFAPLFGKTILKHLNPMHTMGFSMTAGVVVMAIIAAAAGESLAWISTMPLDGWLCLVGLALLPGVAAEYLWYSVLARKEASRLVLAAYLVPVVGISVSHLWLKETLGLFSILCGLGVLAGLMLAQIERKGPKAASRSPEPVSIGESSK